MFTDWSSKSFTLIFLWFATFIINVLCIAKLTPDHHNGVASAGCYLVSHVLVVWLNMKEQKNSELWEVFLCARAHGLKWNVSGC